MFFSEIEKILQTMLTTLQPTLAISKYRVIETLEKTLKSYFSGSTTTFSRQTMKSVTF